MVVTLGQQYYVGEKPTVILYTYINRKAETPSKTKTKYTMSLDSSSICNIGSRIGWVSALLYCHIISPSKLQIDKAGDKVLLSDNYQVNLTTTPEYMRRKRTFRDKCYRYYCIYK